MPTDPERRSREIAAQARAAADPTAWFEELHAETSQGRALVPWDREAPSEVVTAWITSRTSDGAGRPAVVVGCGYGRDAELVAVARDDGANVEGPAGPADRAEIERIVDAADPAISRWVAEFVRDGG